MSARACKELTRRRLDIFPQLGDFGFENLNLDA